MNFLSTIVVPTLLSVATLAIAQSAPVAGDSATAQSIPGSGKVEVVEFFMYSCDLCATLSKEVEVWSKKLPNDINFTRVPVAFAESDLPHSRMYFSLEAMGRQEELHQKIFSAIHAGKKNLLIPEEQAAFLAQFGVDRAKYLEIYHSPRVQVATQCAAAAVHQLQLNSVPSISVDGHLITNPQRAGLASETNQAASMLRLASYRIDRARKGDTTGIMAKRPGSMRSLACSVGRSDEDMPGKNGALH